MVHQLKFKYHNKIKKKISIKFNMTQGQITFNNVKTAGVNMSQWPILLAGQQGPDEEGGVVNAVDIDWNEAKLEDAITALSTNVQEGVAVSNITTSGDLLKVVAQLQAQVNTLTTLVKGLYAALAS